jgi:hypothetical protein
VTESLPPEDPRDALIREQAARLAAQDEQIAVHGERIAALEALVAELGEQLDAARRAASRNSGNSLMPPSSEDLPGRRPAARKERRAAERAERKRKPGKQPGAPGAAMRWRKADEVVGHFPQGDCACGADLADAADLGVARSYQQEDVPEPQPSRRYQHDLHKARCGCGRVHVALRPAGVPDAPLSVGPRLSAYDPSLFDAEVGALTAGPVKDMTWHRSSFGGVPQLCVDLDEPSPAVRDQVQDLVCGAHVGYCMTKAINAQNEPAMPGLG